MALLQIFVWEGYGFPGLDLTDFYGMVLGVDFHDVFFGRFGQQGEIVFHKVGTCYHEALQYHFPVELDGFFALYPHEGFVFGNLCLEWFEVEEVICGENRIAEQKFWQGLEEEARIGIDGGIDGRGVCRPEIFSDYMVDSGQRC